MCKRERFTLHNPQQTKQNNNEIQVSRAGAKKHMQTKSYSSYMQGKAVRDTRNTWGAMEVGVKNSFLFKMLLNNRRREKFGVL